MFRTLYHVVQSVLTTYGALHSWSAIRHLQRYEGAAEKLASGGTVRPGSADAQRQLAETRTTQAVGALALGASLLAALGFASSFYGQRAATGTLAEGAAALVLALALALARQRMVTFWGRRPGADDDADGGGDGSAGGQGGAGPGGNTMLGVARVLPRSLLPAVQMGSFDEARRCTGVVIDVLGWLAASWIVLAAVTMLRGV